ncbi:hypothetical protein CEK25_004708 [Fusarium fujikuroi]|nr:hypothetical protein CEK25_004708 [Fusarium fujikuroi]
MQIDLQAEAPQKKELLVKLLKEVYERPACHQLRHAINYDMPSTTTCHQLRHAINYDMPSTTTCHQLRHAIDYDMPSRCGQQGQLARRRNMTILQRQQGQQGQLARRRNMTILRPVIFVSAGPTSSASLPDIAT